MSDVSIGFYLGLIFGIIFGALFLALSCDSIPGYECRAACRAVHSEMLTLDPCICTNGTVFDDNFSSRQIGEQ